MTTHRLEELRKELNLIDDCILYLIESRSEVCEKVKEVKENNRLGPIDKEREKSILRRLEFKTTVLERCVIEKIFKEIFLLGRSIVSGKYKLKKRF